MSPTETWFKVVNRAVAASDLGKYSCRAESHHFQNFRLELKVGELNKLQVYLQSHIFILADNKLIDFDIID